MSGTGEHSEGTERNLGDRCVERLSAIMYLLGAETHAEAINRISAIKDNESRHRAILKRLGVDDHADGIARILKLENDERNLPIERENGERRREALVSIREQIRRAGLAPSEFSTPDTSEESLVLAYVANALARRRAEAEALDAIKRHITNKGLAPRANEIVPLTAGEHVAALYVKHAITTAEEAFLSKQREADRLRTVARDLIEELAQEQSRRNQESGHSALPPLAPHRITEILEERLRRFEDKPDAEEQAAPIALGVMDRAQAARIAEEHMRRNSEFCHMEARDGNGTLIEISRVSPSCRHVLREGRIESELPPFDFEDSSANLRAIRDSLPRVEPLTSPHPPQAAGEETIELITAGTENGFEDRPVRVNIRQLAEINAQELARRVHFQKICRLISEALGAEGFDQPRDSADLPFDRLPERVLSLLEQNKHRGRVNEETLSTITCSHSVLNGLKAIRIAEGELPDRIADLCSVALRGEQTLGEATERFIQSEAERCAIESAIIGFADAVPKEMRHAPLSRRIGAILAELDQSRNAAEEELRNLVDEIRRANNFLDGCNVAPGSLNERIGLLAEREFRANRERDQFRLVIADEDLGRILLEWLKFGLRIKDEARAREFGDLEPLQAFEVLLGAHDYFARQFADLRLFGERIIEEARKRGALPAEASPNVPEQAFDALLKQYDRQAHDRGIARAMLENLRCRMHHQAKIPCLKHEDLYAALWRLIGERDRARIGEAAARASLLTLNLGARTSDAASSMSEFGSAAERATASIDAGEIREAHRLLDEAGIEEDEDHSLPERVRTALDLLAAERSSYASCAEANSRHCRTIEEIDLLLRDAGFPVEDADLPSRVRLLIYSRDAWRNAAEDKDETLATAHRLLNEFGIAKPYSLRQRLQFLANDRDAARLAVSDAMQFLELIGVPRRPSLPQMLDALGDWLSELSRNVKLIGADQREIKSTIGTLRAQIETLIEERDRKQRVIEEFTVAMSLLVDRHDPTITGHIRHRIEMLVERLSNDRSMYERLYRSEQEARSTAEEELLAEKHRHGATSNDLELARAEIRDAERVLGRYERQRIGDSLATWIAELGERAARLDAENNALDRETIEVRRDLASEKDRANKIEEELTQRNLRCNAIVNRHAPIIDGTPLDRVEALVDRLAAKISEQEGDLRWIEVYLDEANVSRFGIGEEAALPLLRRVAIVRDSLIQIASHADACGIISTQTIERTPMPLAERINILRAAYLGTKREIDEARGVLNNVSLSEEDERRVREATSIGEAIEYCNEALLADVARLLGHIERAHRVLTENGVPIGAFSTLSEERADLDARISVLLAARDALSETIREERARLSRDNCITIARDLLLRYRNEEIGEADETDLGGVLFEMLNPQRPEASAAPQEAAGAAVDLCNVCRKQRDPDAIRLDKRDYFGARACSNCEGLKGGSIPESDTCGICGMDLPCPSDHK